MPGREEFLNIVNDAVIRFPDNRMCRRVIAGEMTLPDYHNLLLTLFHQVYEAPTSMALAAGTCDPEQEVAKDYLLMQADQAKGQWKLIKADLEATGYDGEDPHCLVHLVARDRKVQLEYAGNSIANDITQIQHLD